ncbi:MAG: M23 family metallopeptidase [Cyclobacteriaceae bacterium]|nr:M23 family metallopeptidase [Cyclobacteriaceae bacterium HetDA_MAG_MS6]
MTLGFIITLAISVYLVTSVFDQWLDPRHAEMMANRQVIRLSMSIDSLENEVREKDQYINNVKMLFEGGADAITELVPEEIETTSPGALLRDDITPIDSQFRAEYEQSDLGLLTFVDNAGDELRELYLFSPVSGIVTQGFNPKEDHFGIDIVAKENEGILCVADGVVIFASWTLDSGYVIGVQHRGNLISVYKHNSELLKNVGNFVTSGEIIAIIGNTGELTSGPHLHFELWHKSNPVNPKDYITF